MRGAQRVIFVCHGKRRIIPARAGSTHRGVAACDTPGDHPRSCGEHATLSTAFGIRQGSSPLVRGALAAALHERGVWGIIPARAGSTEKFQKELDESEDHPRSCGEHSTRRSTPRGAAGSSPLVRGAPISATGELSTTRIIPARAGSTATKASLKVTDEDHPRSCGEHQVMLVAGQTYTGSSPLVRGAPEIMPLTASLLGIIPARAGSTL